jgi:hypothetical protein
MRELRPAQAGEIFPTRDTLHPTFQSPSIRMTIVPAWFSSVPPSSTMEAAAAVKASSVSGAKARPAA